MIKKFGFIWICFVVVLASTFWNPPIVNAQSYYQIEQTTATLNSGVAFTSSAFETRGLETIGVNVTASHDSAAGGVDINFANVSGDCVDFTPTGSNMDYTANTTGWSYTATTKDSYATTIRGNCAWIVYTNGGTNQTSFKLTIYGDIN